MSGMWFFSLLQSGLGKLAESGEGLGIVDGGLGEHLAVHVNARELETVHEGGVVHPVELAARADAGDPQGTEISLLLLASDICVTAGLHDLLVRHLEVTGLVAPVALCQAKHLASVLAQSSTIVHSCDVLGAKHDIPARCIRRLQSKRFVFFDKT